MKRRISIDIVLVTQIAVLKCADAITRWWNGIKAINGVETWTVIESSMTNGCDAVGDGHRSQAATLTESRRANGCDAVGDGDRD